MIVWGECSHVFHMHCLLKWISTDSSRQQCPMVSTRRRRMMRLGSKTLVYFCWFVFFLKKRKAKNNPMLKLGQETMEDKVVRHHMMILGSGTEVDTDLCGRMQAPFK